MILFPYRVEFGISRFPVMTLGIIALCCGVYYAQVRSDRLEKESAEASCRGVESAEDMAIAEFHFSGGCKELVQRLAAARDAEAEIATVVDRISGERPPQDWPDFVADTARERLKRYRNYFPRGSLTDRLDYYPESWNPLRMLTSGIAHGSLSHLLGNMYFFWVFGATVEAFLGPVWFLIAMIAVELGTDVTYSLVNMGTAAPPTLGLSGAICGMMGMFAYAMPDARIRTFIWFFWRMWFKALPAWFIVGWYVGFDALMLLSKSGGTVNLVAHVSGASIGAFLAATLFRRQAVEARAAAMSV
jgi:membrane associated rhomboid family serine protease